MTSYDNLGGVKEKMLATTARGRMHAAHYGGDASHEKYKEVTTMSHWSNQARLARSLDVASSMCVKYMLFDESSQLLLLL